MERGGIGPEGGCIGVYGVALAAGADVGSWGGGGVSAVAVGGEGASGMSAMAGRGLDAAVGWWLPALGRVCGAIGTAVLRRAHGGVLSGQGW